MPQIHIREPDDPRLAEYRTLPEPELVRSKGLFIAEGRLVVKRLLQNPRHRVRSVLVSETARRALADSLAARGDDVEVFICAAEHFRSVTGFNLHRGCLALAERPKPVDFRTLVSEARMLVVLEGVGNADNVGGVFRNAAAFGVDAVLLSPGCCDPLYRKAIRTSMGASLSVPFSRVEPWPGGLAALADEGFDLVAFTPDASATGLAAFARRLPVRRLALLFGHEGGGLTGAAQSHAKYRVRIPINPEIDSLNLAVASGVALSWLTRPEDLA